ncbi:hypothetical protein GCM10020254_65240 [Streptomyces goshikiensis]
MATIRWWAWWCSRWRARTWSKWRLNSSSEPKAPESRSRPSQGGGVGGEQGGGAAAGVLGGLGGALAAQGAEDGGAGEQGGGVDAVGFGEQPFAGPCGGGGGFGEGDDAVPAAVPVVRGGDEEGAGLGPPALGELASHVDQFGVTEGGVEELRVPLAGARKGRRGAGTPRVPSRTRARAGKGIRRTSASG